MLLRISKLNHQVGKPGIVPFGPLQNGGRRDCLGDNIRASRKNEKNSSQKNAGAFAVTTGLPERPRIPLLWKRCISFFMEQAHKTPRICHEISYYCPEAAKDVHPH